jgi:hypothetical protein
VKKIYVKYVRNNLVNLEKIYTLLYMDTDNIIISLQQQLDIEKEENINYINLISEQRQEIENLKVKIEFLEKEIKIINEQINQQINQQINRELIIKPIDSSILSRMMSWIR